MRIDRQISLVERGMMTMQSIEPRVMQLKANLLCYGVKCKENVLRILQSKLPHANKYVHNACFYLDKGVNLNISIGEGYMNDSPYELLYNEDKFYVSEDSNMIEIKLIPPPDWVFKKTMDGTHLNEVLTLHGINTLCLSYHKCCDYNSNELTCKFCSFNDAPQQTYNIKNVGEAFSIAFKENPHYNVALSNGTLFNQQLYAQFFLEIIEIIKQESPKCRISVELSPIENDKLNMLFDSGIDSVFMNIEFSDENIRKLMCPGKSNIPKEQYIKSLSYAVEKLGRGKVSSVIICGIEKNSLTVELARNLIDIGVIPIVIPFKPYDNCYLRNLHTTNANDLSYVYFQINKYMREVNFTIPKQHACNGCGGCSGVSEMLRSYIS